MATRLVAETAWSPVALDALVAGTDNASQPEVAFGDSGAGFVTAGTSATNQLVATPVAANGYLETPACWPLVAAAPRPTRFLPARAAGR